LTKNKKQLFRLLVKRNKHRNQTKWVLKKRSEESWKQKRVLSTSIRAIERQYWKLCSEITSYSLKSW